MGIYSPKVFMNLLEIRTEFVKQSGRYDLVVDAIDFADAGANYFINSGQDYLDRQGIVVPESEGKIIKTIFPSEYYISFQNRCRVIQSVWANNSSSRVELRKVDWEELKNLYNSPVSDISNGAPLYYTPAKLREVDVGDKDSTGIFINFTKSSSFDYRGILVLPPIDENYDIEIFGKFYQKTLVEDLDENYWTIETPSTLITAALRQIEISYRNVKARREWEGVIDKDLQDLDMDIVDEETSTIEEMGE